MIKTGLKPKSLRGIFFTDQQGQTYTMSGRVYGVVSDDGSFICLNREGIVSAWSRSTAQMVAESVNQDGTAKWVAPTHSF